MIFGRLPEDALESVLELGAGDGFQSALLRHHARRVVSTSFKRPPHENAPDGSLVYLRCDAHAVSKAFAGESFDVVFSSNMLEHIPDPQAVLLEIRSVLAPGGVTIHVMPSPLWKASHLLFHFPNLLRIAFRHLRGGGRVAELIPGYRRWATAPDVNNPGKPSPSPRTATRLLLPAPHGWSPTNRREFGQFARARWIKEFKNAGFDVVTVRKGPLASGYGLGLDRMRAALERLGMTTHFVYVACRTEERGAPVVSYFV